MNKRYIDFVPSNNVKAARTGRRGAAVHVEMPEAQPAARRAAPSRNTTAGRVVRRETSGVVENLRETEIVDLGMPVRREVVNSTRTRMPAAKSVRSNTGTSVRTSVGTRASVNAGASRTSSSTGRVVGAPALGVVEDLNGKFVKTDVPKRPLSDGKGVTAREAAKAKKELEAAKSKRLIGRRASKKADKAGKAEVAKQKKQSDKSDGKYKMPKSPFINQEKVVKRPLSKNVYQKKAEVPKEKPAGPVAIIAKPEKDSRVGIVVAIIVTIILGAAAGTVAFLLLPK